MKLSLDGMTRREKLELMEALWADLAKEPDLIESPAWHAEELAETERRVASGEETFVDWEIAKRQILERLQKRRSD